MIQTRAKQIEQIQAEYPNLDRLMVEMVLDTPSDVLDKIVAEHEENEKKNPYTTPPPENLLMKSVEIN